MHTKTNRPSILTITVKEKASDVGSEKPREQPALLFPAWTTPYDSSSNPEQFENVSIGFWAYNKDWREPLYAYDKICKRLTNQCICEINPTPGVSMFWEEMRNAQHFIFLLDNNIGPHEFCRILQVLKSREHARDASMLKVLLLTNLSKDADKKTLQLMLEDAKSKFTITKTLILILSTAHDKSIHDRFALIDDSIWHFGSTIGAMHRSVNAFSGPWMDKDGTMQKFFCSLVNTYKSFDFIGTWFDLEEYEE